MDSLLGENRLILFLKHQSSFSRLLITFSIIFFISVFWFIFSHNRFSGLICSEEVIKNNNLREIALLKKTNANLVCVNKNKSDLLNITKNLLEEGCFQGSLNKMLDCLQSNKLICSDLNPVNVKKKDYYKKKYFTLKTKGNFENIFSFFKNAKNSLQNVKFKKVGFLKNEDAILLESKVRIVSYSKKHVA